MNTQKFFITITEPGVSALEVLAERSALPKMRIKDAMAKGAVWVKRKNKSNRLRRATAVMQVGDELQLYYNADILALAPGEAKLLRDEKAYSVWIKPAGMLAQGSQEGDHCALLRIVEKTLQRECFLVHRLDREASGLMLIAHTQRAAAAFSSLFAKQTQNEQTIRKLYRVQVRGELPTTGSFEADLDGKTAHTRFERLSWSAEKNSSCAEVELVSGRKHQIRRHFADAGFPVLGDPRYGSNNRCDQGLQLFAIRLEFICPLRQCKQLFEWLPAD